MRRCDCVAISSARALEDLTHAANAYTAQSFLSYDASPGVRIPARFAIAFCRFDSDRTASPTLAWGSRYRLFALGLPNPAPVRRDAASRVGRPDPSRALPSISIGFREDWVRLRMQSRYRSLAPLMSSTALTNRRTCNAISAARTHRQGHRGSDSPRRRRDIIANLLVVEQKHRPDLGRNSPPLPLPLTRTPAEAPSGEDGKRAVYRPNTLRLKGIRDVFHPEWRRRAIPSWCLRVCR